VTRIILVTHDALGEAMRREAETILDRRVSLSIVAVSYRAEVDRTIAVLREALAQTRDGEVGAIVLTDLPGATPHNLARKAAGEYAAPVVSGLNLPMLLKVINHADKPAEELADLAASGGRQAIIRT
jgi:mannose/fructose-specific phosphotransferase system component IIA